MHLGKITVFPERYPNRDHYPFNLPIFQQMGCIPFDTPVTLFVGENGTGKSTLIRAICQRCGIHIWQDDSKVSFQFNPYQEMLQHCLDLDWVRGRVPGSFFGADIFKYFTQVLDEWARSDPGQFSYFGGRSLVTLSHGQSLMSFFQSRYRVSGLYFLDEPETALSPNSQLELLKLLVEMGRLGHAQFIIASHSPILLACPGASLYSFDTIPLTRVSYEETDHYRIYQAFMRDRSDYLKGLGS
ncbi:MAG: AAA family ATPase [Anaerolineales bacterium]|nr:AAA family ATPase [Anaerolineales bacterium]